VLLLSIIVAAPEVTHPFHTSECDPFESLPLRSSCSATVKSFHSFVITALHSTPAGDSILLKQRYLSLFRNASVNLNTSKMGKKTLNLVIASVLVTLASAAPLATEKRGTLPSRPAKLYGMMLNVT
jgi:hypothetical protein